MRFHDAQELFRRCALWFTTQVPIKNEGAEVFGAGVVQAYASNSKLHVVRDTQREEYVEPMSTMLEQMAHEWMPKCVRHARATLRSGLFRELLHFISSLEGYHVVETPRELCPDLYNESQESLVSKYPVPYADQVANAVDNIKRVLPGRDYSRGPKTPALKKAVREHRSAIWSRTLGRHVMAKICSKWQMAIITEVLERTEKKPMVVEAVSTFTLLRIL